MNERMFPIQAEQGAKPFPIQVPWSVAELAYSVYASRYGRRQSLERLAERGGFGPGEMDMFLPGWRERCDEITQLKDRLRHAEQRAADAEAIVEKLPLTADGVRVVPGMELWSAHRWKAKITAVLNEAGYTHEITDHVNCLYSTREAAESAAKGGQAK